MMAPPGCCHPAAFDANKRLIAECRKKLTRENVSGVATNQRACTGHGIPPSRQILLLHDRLACSCRPSDRMFRVICPRGGYHYPTTLDSDSSNLVGATVTNLSAVTTKKAFRNLSDVTFQVMTSPWWQNQLSPGP